MLDQIWYLDAERTVFVNLHRELIVCHQGQLDTKRKYDQYLIGRPRGSRDD